MLAPLLGATLLAGPAEAGIMNRLRKLFVFGDSLSDSGNSKLLSNAASGMLNITFPPSPPYFGGRFSNGEVAAEILWKTFNPGDTTFQPSLITGGTNYAIGGATSGQKNVISLRTDIGALAGAYANKGNAWELPQFATAPPVFDPETSLFMVWLFPNDVFWDTTTAQVSVGGFNNSSVPPASSGLIPTAIYNIKGTVQSLFDKGARKFLVPNTPNLGSTPEYRNDPVLGPKYTQYSQDFNDALAVAIGELTVTNPGIEIVDFQTDDLFLELRGNGGLYGLTNVDDRCLVGFTACANPDSYLFWDGNHPTAATHKILGQRLFQSVYAVPGPLPAAGALAGFAWSRRLRRRLRLHSPKNQP
jgi:phospholipase/lecithinase/hemolysin